MFKLLTSLIDRCIFTAVFIIGVQLPEFIQQYSQRLSGHLNESLQQLEQFQLIANRHFEGNLSTMIQKYSSNIEPSISETGDLIVNTSQRVKYLDSHLKSIEQTDYFKQLHAFITEYDLPMAQATLKQFQLAIPLDFMALATGAALAFLILVMIYAVIGSVKLTANWLIRKPKAIQDSTSYQEADDISTEKL